MSLGLGHKYWVRMLSHHYGTLSSCLDFMRDNPPKDKFEWYELRPDVNVKEESCELYSCDLVSIKK